MVSKSYLRRGILRKTLLGFFLGLVCGASLVFVVLNEKFKEQRRGTVQSYIAANAQNNLNALTNLREESPEKGIAFLETVLNGDLESLKEQKNPSPGMTVMIRMIEKYQQKYPDSVRKTEGAMSQESTE